MKVTNLFRSYLQEQEEEEIYVNSNCHPKWR
jgi:hypothetical protein